MTEKRNLSILIVDHVKAMRDILKSVLEQLGFKDITEAEGGKRAIQLLREKQFDLIITDLNMPDMTGLSLLNIIKADNTLKEIPVIIVTAQSGKEYIGESIRVGASNYILRPYTPESMQDKINTTVRSISA